MCELIGVFELSDALDEGTWTVFAPTNEAFSAVADTIADLDPAVILDILSFHAVQGTVVMSSDLVCDGFLTMVNEQDSQTLCEDGSIFQVGEGNSPDMLPEIDPADIPACNGVIHVVDNVMIPGGVLTDAPTGTPVTGVPPEETNAPGSTVMLTLTINFDGFAPETAWEITNSTGGTVMMVPAGTYEPLAESATEEIDVTAGSNYTFTIFDLFGDGMSNPEGGDYTLSQDVAGVEVVLAAGGGNFGSESSTNFTAF